jgi:hypothetical protein
MRHCGDGTVHMRFEKSCSFFVLRGFLPNCTLTRKFTSGKIYGFKTPISKVRLNGERTTGGKAENWDMNA